MKGSPVRVRASASLRPGSLPPPVLWLLDDEMGDRSTQLYAFVRVTYAKRHNLAVPPR
jgi:hypothetical protein